MNRTAILLSIVLLVGCTSDKKNQTPAPTQGETQIHSSESKESQSERTAWIESMHNAPPGIDWRSIEKDNQRDKVKRLKSRKPKSGTIEEFANGTLSGEWIERGPSNQAGSILSTLHDPDDDKVFYISAGGTLFKTSLDGSDHVIVNQDVQLNGDYLERIDNNGNTRLLAKIGHALHFSDDKGLTWTKSSGINITSSSWGRTDVEAYGDGTVILAASKPDYWDDYQLYLSTNQGASFQSIKHLDISDNQDIELYKPDNADDIYLALRISDKVQMWQFNNTSLSITNLTQEIVTEFDEPLILKPTAVKLADGNTRHYFYSDNNILIQTQDQGATFYEAGTLPKSPWGLIYALPSDPDFMLMGEVEAWRSENGGASWTQVNGWGEYYNDVPGKLHADIMSYNEIITNDGTPLVLTGHHGGLSKSYDALGTNLNITIDGISTAQYYDVRTLPSDHNVILAGSQDQGFQRSTGTISDGIHKFSQLVSGDYGKIAFARNDESMWTVYPDGDVAYFANASTTQWPTAWYTIESDDESVWLPPLITGPDPTKDEILIAGGNKDGGSGTHVMKMTYENETIVVDQYPYDFNPSSNGKITALAISNIDDKRFFVGTAEGAIFYSMDGGVNWDRGVNNIPNGHYLYGAALLPSKVSSDVVYVGGSGYSNPAVVMSDNGGRNFDAMSLGLPSTTVFDLDMNSDGTMIFAATEAGPYVYITSDARWYDINGQDTPRQSYWSVEYLEKEDIVRFGTHGRGVWDFNIAHENVAVSKKPSLEGKINVFPNPSIDGYIQIDAEFHDALTSVNYTIYNSEGRMMSQGHLPNSNNIHTRVNLNSAPSGIYYLNITAAQGQKTVTLYRQ